MGGDSAGVSGLSISTRGDPKVFSVNSFIMGFTTSFRMGQLLMCGFNPTIPEPSLSRSDLYAHMVTIFIDEVRSRFKYGGWMEKTNEQEKGGDFLVAIHGVLFVIHSDFQVGVPLDGYDAVGSGSDIAHGALYATKILGLDPRRRIEIALSAAAEHNAGVRPPFKIVTNAPVPPKKPGRRKPEVWVSEIYHTNP